MQVNMHEAKSQLSKLIEKALAGEEVIIARNNKPVVHLVPVESNSNELFKFDQMKGFVKYISDDFDEPLDDFKDYM